MIRNLLTNMSLPFTRPGNFLSPGQPLSHSGNFPCSLRTVVQWRWSSLQIDHWLVMAKRRRAAALSAPREKQHHEQQHA